MQLSLESKLLIFVLVLLIVAWTLVMMVTGSNWWGYEGSKLQKIETPSLILDSAQNGYQR